MKKVILVIDDDPQIRESLGKLLRAEGYKVALAATGRESLEIFDSQPIDLVLLDINLPEYSGWELFGSISNTNPLVPIVVITGKEKQKETAALAGIGGLMEKPLNLPALLEMIRVLISEDPKMRLRRLMGLHTGLNYVPHQAWQDAERNEARV